MWIRNADRWKATGSSLDMGPVRRRWTITKVEGRVGARRRQRHHGPGHLSRMALRHLRYGWGAGRHQRASMQGLLWRKDKLGGRTPATGAASATSGEQALLRRASLPPPPTILLLRASFPRTYQPGEGVSEPAVRRHLPFVSLLTRTRESVLAGL